MSLAYLELKLSRELYGRAPDALSDKELYELSRTAERQRMIEQTILTSREASACVVRPHDIRSRVNDIASRYEDDEELTDDLGKVGMTRDDLHLEVERDLRIEAVLEQINATVAPVTESDAAEFYRTHPDAFDRPEARRLRHILITANSESEASAAHETLRQLRPAVGTIAKFSKAALRHSQCPTAMDGGLLGLVKRGQLYPELEPAAFMLEAGALSEVLRSPMGMHLIRCDEVLPGGVIPFSEVKSRVIERLQQRREAQAQKRWLAGRHEVMSA